MTYNDMYDWMDWEGGFWGFHESGRELDGFEDASMKVIYTEALSAFKVAEGKVRYFLSKLEEKMIEEESRQLGD